MESLKIKLRIRVLKNNLTVFKEFGQKLRAVQKVTFKNKYGNLLGLLRVEVQTPAVTTLA